MKIFFWVLVAANLIFFAVMKSGMLDEAQEPVPVPLHAEQISILNAASSVAEQASAVAPASAPAAPASAASSAPAATSVPVNSCFEWGEFSGAEIGKVVQALQKMHLGKRLSRHEVGHTIGYWVYIPPLKDKAAVTQKVAQIKSLGVSDYFVVQDAGAWMNAISLGVFKTQDAAQSFLEELQAKGVHSAKIGEKSGSKPSVMFELNGLNRDESDRLGALQKDFSDIQLKSVSCH